MNLKSLLNKAGVDEDLIPQAIKTLENAEHSSDGLLWKKWKVRLFKAHRIADLLEWQHERLTDAEPNLADWDIAPMFNITAHGDNVPWPDGKPAPGAWLEDTVEARAANYWCKGEHPRSKKSRKAWYRRNAGEMVAYKRGLVVPIEAPQKWEGNGVVVRKLGDAWQINAQVKLLGFIPAKARVGYEISNVIKDDGTQLWYPLPLYAFKAPLTWSVIPGK